MSKSVDLGADVGKPPGVSYVDEFERLLDQESYAPERNLEDDLYVSGAGNRLSRFLTSIIINFIYKTLVYFGTKYEDIPALESQTRNRAWGASENLCYLDRQIIIYNKYLSVYEIN